MQSIGINNKRTVGGLQIDSVSQMIFLTIKAMTTGVIVAWRD